MIGLFLLLLCLMWCGAFVAFRLCSVVLFDVVLLCVWSLCVVLLCSVLMSL